MADPVTRPVTRRGQDLGSAETLRVTGWTVIFADRLNCLATLAVYGDKGIQVGDRQLAFFRSRSEARNRRNVLDKIASERVMAIRRAVVTFEILPPDDRPARSRRSRRQPRKQTR
jgi:hypothetical protein